MDQFLYQCDDTYITVCSDVFSSAFAPGVSAPQSLGLDPEIVLPLIKHVLRTRKVRGFDICEISPRFDQIIRPPTSARSLFLRWSIHCAGSMV